MEEDIAKYQSDKTELLALREYVYKLKFEEAESEHSPQYFNNIMERLKTKKILIIGGPTVWHGKIKTFFPGWITIDPACCHSVDFRIFDGIEKVYFRSDYLSHALYYRVINDLKEKNIPYGYVNYVNIKKLAEQISDDLN